MWMVQSTCPYSELEPYTGFAVTVGQPSSSSNHRGPVKALQSYTSPEERVTGSHAVCSGYVMVTHANIRVSLTKACS